MEIGNIGRDGRRRRNMKRPRAVFMAFGTKGDVHPIGVSAKKNLPFCFSFCRLLNSI